MSKKQSLAKENTKASDNSVLARWPVWKQGVYISATLFALFVSLELVLSTVYFRLVGNAPLAIVGTINAARERVTDWKKDQMKRTARERIARYNVPRGLTTETFDAPGVYVLEHLVRRYEDDFAQLARAARELGVRLIVFYPGGDAGDTVIEYHRNFFANLAKRHSVEYADMGPGFDGYHEEDLSLLPFNAHFSKFGNRLIAKRLAEILQKHVDYRLRNSLDSKAANFGDLPPALNEIWDEASEAPYRVKTNQYGFRMNEDFQLDTPKQKILVLGDSITFGPYLANHDTYTDMLGRMMPHAIIMNAGISGYSIPDQWSLFQEKAKFANPDIVVLQVFHNDLTDLFYFKRNEFDRLGRVHEPTLIEIEFLETVHKLRSATPGTRRSGDLN